jgi:hypothetical protein
MHNIWYNYEHHSNASPSPCISSYHIYGSLFRPYVSYLWAPWPCLIPECNSNPLSVDLRLRKHDYFKSLYSSEGYPSAIEVSNVVEEYLQGLSIVTRGFYDTQGITHGWTVYSSQTSSKLFTSIHTRAPIEGVSTEKWLNLESIIQAIHCIRIIGEAHALSDGKITLFAIKKELCVYFLVFATIMFHLP